MLRNPEFTKNLKLEFNSTRVIIPLVILALISWISWSSSNHIPSSQFEDPDFGKAKNLYIWLYGFGFFFTIVWGGYLAANSIVEEVKQKTWDFVRLSSLPPAHIIAGKLIGSNFAIWLVSLGVVIPLVLFCGSILIPDQFTHLHKQQTLALLAVTLILWALFSHTAALYLGLTQLKDRQIRSGSFTIVLPILLLGIWIGASIVNCFDDYYQVYKIYLGSKTYIPPNAIVVNDSYMRSIDTIGWYGFQVAPLALIASLLALACAWSLIGTYRLLRSKLLYKDSPWVWVAFLLCASVVLAGFQDLNSDNNPLASLLAWATVVSIISILATCLDEARQTVRYRACAAFFMSGQYKEALRIIPLWILSFAFMIVSAALIIPMTNSPTESLLLFLSYLGFMCRDLLVIHAISWSSKIRRPIVGVALYFTLVYGLLPPVLKIIFFDADAPRYLIPAVKSLNSMNPGLADTNLTIAYWLGIAAQIAIAFLLFRRKWDKALTEA